MRRLPAIQKAARATIYWNRELLVLGLAKLPKLMKGPEALARAHLVSQVADPDLRAKLTPNFPLGCKRILLSNEYYPSLTQPNVEVITDGIREITPHSIVAADGTEREIDTIIFGTGFQVAAHPIGHRIRGANGQTLAQDWADGMRAHVGTTVAGFPNLFIMTGPNTGLGHSSMVLMMESQFAYILDGLDQMQSRGLSSVDVRPEVQTAYNEGLQKQLKGTIWSAGCSSWYLDKSGRNTTLWPTFTFSYRARMKRFDTASYRLVTRRSVPADTH